MATNLAAWSGWITCTAEENGWRVHDYPDQHANAGFPDLVLVRGSEMLLIEPKLEPVKITAGQQRWLDALDDVSQVVTQVWSPSRMAEYVRMLER